MNNPGGVSKHKQRQQKRRAAGGQPGSAVPPEGDSASDDEPSGQQQQQQQQQQQRGSGASLPSSVASAFDAPKRLAQRKKDYLNAKKARKKSRHIAKLEDQVERVSGAARGGPGWGG